MSEQQNPPPPQPAFPPPPQKRSTGRTVGAVVLTVLAVICAGGFLGSLSGDSESSSGGVDIVALLLALGFGGWAAALWRPKR